MSGMTFFILRCLRKSFAIRLLCVVQLCALLYFVDDYLLLLLSDWQGKYMALAVMLGTGVVGLLFVSNAIDQSLCRIRRNTSMAGERASSQAYSEIIAVILSGALLVIPGFGSDAIGLLIYFPPIRGVAQKGIRSLFAREMSQVYEYVRLFDM